MKSITEKPSCPFYSTLLYLSSSFPFHSLLTCISPPSLSPLSLSSLPRPLGAKQELWLTSTVEKERSKDKSKIAEKEKSQKSCRYMREKAFVLEQCIQLLESKSARTYGQNDVHNARMLRIKISLAECYREVGSADKAKYLLGTFLFRLNMEEEERKLEDRSRSDYSILLYSTLLYSTLLYSTSFYSIPFRAMRCITLPCMALLFDFIRASLDLFHFCIHFLPVTIFISILL